jgi:hypothetical protein
MEFLEGIQKGRKLGMVRKLNKAFYGLKNSSKVWYKRFDDYLVSIGFTKNKANSNVYILKKDSSYMILAIYVDDTILASNNLVCL